MVKPACTESPKYKGVRKRKWGKWVSEVRLPNSRERIWLGSFESPEKAARAFDAAQYCLRGNYGNYNFPENPPVIPGARSLTPQEIQAVAFRFANESTNDNNNNNGNTSNNENNNNVGTTEQYTSSSSVSVSDAMQVETERHDETTMDWSSFLSMLDTGQAMSDYGFYGDHFYLPLPPPPVDDDDDEYQNGEGDVFSQQSSFLWNF